MLCNFCDNTATIFLTHIVNDEMQKVSLCESCSQNQELIKKKNLEAILGEYGIDKKDKEMNPIEEYSSPSKACQCGLSMEILSKTSRLGCPKCYTTFSDILTNRIEKIHNGTTHEGKKIYVPVTLKRLEEKKERLNLDLQSAVEDEEFEKAAQIRDAITSVDDQIASI